jgi:hypothetical protein
MYIQTEPERNRLGRSRHHRADLSIHSLDRVTACCPCPPGRDEAGTCRRSQSSRVRPPRSNTACAVVSRLHGSHSPLALHPPLSGEELPFLFLASSLLLCRLTALGSPQVRRPPRIAVDFIPQACLRSDSQILGMVWGLLHSTGSQ